MANRCSRNGSWVVIGGAWLLVCGILLAQEPDRAPAEALARRAADRLQALRHEADELASQEQSVLGDLRKLEIDRQLRGEEFKLADSKAQAGAAELPAATSRVRDLEQRELAERPGLRTRLVEIYKLGQGRYLRLLL